MNHYPYDPRYQAPNTRFGPGSCENERPWAPGIDDGRRFAGPIGSQQVLGLPPHDRWVVVPGLTEIAAEEEGNLIQFPWGDGFKGGLVVGLRAHALGVGDADSLASLALRLTVGGAGLEVITNGTGGAYITLAAMLGMQAVQPSNFMREIKNTDNWGIQFRNYSADTAYTPFLAFAFRSKDFPLNVPYPSEQ